jgi:hypothetical protein
MKLERLKEIVDNEVGFDISVKRRIRDLVYYRYIFFKIAREQLKGLTTTAIGKSLNRDHATVLHGLKKIEHELDYNKEINNLYHKISDIVSNELEVDIINDCSENDIIQIKKHYEDRILSLRTRIQELERLSNKKQNSLLTDIKKLTDADVLEFRETRLKPYLKMLETRKKHIVIAEVKGALLVRPE